MTERRAARIGVVCALVVILAKLAAVASARSSHSVRWSPSTCRS
jgi:hypothetical protein